MITVEIQGTLTAIGFNCNDIELKMKFKIDANSFEAAKYAATDALRDLADKKVSSYINRGVDMTVLSLQLDSIVDHENNQRHYGQLPRHYCH